MSEDNNKNIKEDYETSRDTYLELMETGKRGLDLMVEVARESEHPRAFEVLSGMIKNVADVTDKLMDLNKKNKDIVTESKKKEGVTNNNVFIGSAADLQKMLQENNEKVIEHDDHADEPSQTSE